MKYFKFSLALLFVISLVNVNINSLFNAFFILRLLLNFS